MLQPENDLLQGMLNHTLENVDHTLVKKGKNTSVFFYFCGKSALINGRFFEFGNRVYAFTREQQKQKTTEVFDGGDDVSMDM